MASKTAMTIFGPPDLFANDMRKIINDTEFSDIVFIVGEEREKIHAHKVVLSGRCEVFRAMFLDQKSQTESKGKSGKFQGDAPLILQDVRPAVFLAVLEFIYSNSCKLTQNIVVDVLASGIEYGLDGLIQACIEYIVKNLSVETASEAIQAAVTYNLEELRATCIQFIETHPSVFSSKNFVYISEDTFSFILQSDKLQIDEAEILAALKQWGEVNSVVAGKSVGDVISKVVEHVRFPLLTADVLTKLEKENEKSNIIPVRLISRAWKYHATKSAEDNNPQFKPRAGTKK